MTETQLNSVPVPALGKMNATGQTEWNFSQLYEERRNILRKPSKTTRFST